MLLDEARPPPRITARTPRPRLDQNIHPAAGGDGEQPEAEEPAQLAHARIVRATAAGRCAHREPDLVACGGAVDALEHELEVEGELELAHNHDRRLVPAQRHQITAAD